MNYLHEDMVQDIENAKYTKADMEKLISQLGHGQWFSDKVPYGYCYVTGHNDILNGVSRHGYHVSGIAAANGDEASGGIAGVALTPLFSSAASSSSSKKLSPRQILV